MKKKKHQQTHLSSALHSSQPRSRNCRRKNIRKFVFISVAALAGLIAFSGAASAQPSPIETPDQTSEQIVPDSITHEMNDYPIVKLRSLDKVTARTMTFEANVGATVKFGALYIKVQACRKAPPIEQPESAAFLQIWEITPAEEAEWVFSGWMFASSPGLSSMDHPIYDVWVLDCLEQKGPKDEAVKKEEAARGEGEIPESKIPVTPDAAMKENIPVEDAPEN